MAEMVPTFNLTSLGEKKKKKKEHRSPLKVLKRSVPVFSPLHHGWASHNKQMITGPGLGEVPIARFYVHNLTQIKHYVWGEVREEMLSA